MPEDNTRDARDIFHLPPLPDVAPEESNYAWSRGWVIANTLATGVGAVTGLVALVVAVIALTS